MHDAHRPLRSRIVGALAVLLVAFSVWATPAAAHEGEESAEAAVLVRQAIAIMVNEPESVDAVADKLSDAAVASDQTGVDLALLAEASDALAAGDMHRARALAEQSIGAQPHIGIGDPPRIGETTPATPPTVTATPDSEGADLSPGSPSTMPMATGAEPGRASFSDPLSVQPGLTRGDWAVLALSLAVGLVGVYLSLRFRPPRHEVRP